MSDSDKEENDDVGNDKNVILHVAVVGFHHKKGTILEYSYPPLCEGETHSSSVLPTCWSCLPALALPDGAHQHDEDSSFFLLPARNSDLTLFGISCYRQIETKKLKVRDKDVTRDTVQKSVVLISTKPVFGVLKAKLEIVSAAFFEERDFSQVQILKELHEQVNLAVGTNINEEIYLTGLSPRDLILSFRHRTLILFKLLLIEKRLIFFGSAAGLGAIVLTLVSLFPKLLENGLYYASGEEPKLEKDENVNDERQNESIIDNDDAISHKSIRSEHDVMKSPILEQIADGLNKLGRRGSTLLKDFIEVEYMDLSDDEVPVGLEEPGLHEVAGFGSLVLELPTPPREEPRPEVIPESSFDCDSMGYPLSIFSGNYLLMPYACLQQHSLLKDVSRHNGFVVASSNVLFKAQRHLSDVMVEAESPFDIEYRDANLEKHLKLTQADLRFIDALIAKVETSDDTQWEGSDQWIRAQFKKYLNGLLFSTMTTESKARDDYGRSYIDLVTKTRHHKIWRFGSKSEFFLSRESYPHPAAIPTQNPFTDFKLRITSSLQSTQRGRLVEEALTNTVDKTMKTAGSWFSAIKASGVNQLQNIQSQLSTSNGSNTTATEQL